jgi:hypothetical protein
MPYEYPMSLRFKIIALSSQIYVEDAHGRELLYVKQKAFKLKEDVRIFQDKTQTNELFQMKADRVLDISPRFTITDPAGNVFGYIKREGLRSLWKASYLLMDSQGVETHHIKEESPWLKVLDGLLSEIPILGLFTNYLIHPSYLVYETGTEKPLFRLTKQPAFFEGRFKVEKLADIPDEWLEVRLVLGQMMMMVFERARG